MKKTASLCLIAAMLLTGCSFGSSNQNANSTANVQKSTSNKFIMGGKIASNEQADIMSKISAKVTDISVDVGSSVKEGDVVIKLDTKDLQAQVDQAQAAVNTAKASLVNAQNTTRPEQIEEAGASLESAGQTYDTAKKNYDRIKALVDSGAETQAQLDTANQQLAVANGQYKNAQAALEMLKNGPTKSSIDVFSAQVDQANAALKTAQVALSNATITSPISGSVSAKNINVGEMATAGAKLISIVNSGNLYVDSYAPVDIANKLSVGQGVIIKVSELDGKEYKGKVSVINSKLDTQSTDVLVKVTITDKDPKLEPGMFAEIGLE